MKKAVSVLMAGALVLLSPHAFAKTTTIPITFAKGSYCGSFEGDVSHRKFTLSLNARQTLSILLEDTPTPIVKDPKGKRLTAIAEDEGVSHFIAKTKGTYSVVFNTDDGSDVYHHIKFCAE